jgi:hypothetical protein
MPFEDDEFDREQVDDPVFIEVFATDISTDAGQGSRKVMFSYDAWKPNARADAYTKPCGRYTVERTGAERFDVYGPCGFID